jgi:hypothetical protein
MNFSSKIGPLVTQKIDFLSALVPKLSVPIEQDSHSPFWTHELAPPPI